MSVFVMRSALIAVTFCLAIALVVVSANACDPQCSANKSQHKSRELVAGVVAHVSEERMAEAKPLFRDIDDKVWESYMEQFAFLRRKLGEIKVVRLTDVQKRNMEGEEHFVMTWEFGKSDSKVVLTQSVGVRFHDGSLGMAKGTMEAQLSGSDWLGDEAPKLLSFKLIVPEKNRMFKKVYRSFARRFAKPARETTRLEIVR